MTTNWTAALLAATAMTFSTAAPALAQDAPAPDAAAEAPPSPEEAAAQIEFLKAQVDAMQAQLDLLKKATAAATPSYGAAPQWKDQGFSFKVNGVVQYDSGYVSNPDNRINTPNLGFNSRSRRLLLGVGGDVPGGFKYSMTMDFAQGLVNFEDVILSYEPAGKPFSVTIGYFYPYNSLENLTSNRFTSFVERAQMNDAFSNTRRLGIGLGYVSKAGDFRVNGGVFSQAAIDNTFDNNGYMFSGRAVYSPQAMGGQLHFGASAQYRRFKTTTLGMQYRARPFTQITDQRFVDAGTVAGKADTIIGLEAAGIFHSLHVAGEAQYLKVQGLRPGYVPQPGQTVLGTLYASNPSFFSAYGEVGFWLTGETRGYKNGKFDRTKVLNGFDKGGWGGLQAVARVDYLDLTDNVGGVAAGLVDGSINGGKQVGYELALNWWPIDYVRFTAQYIHSAIEGGPRAATVRPLDTRALTDRKFGVDAAVVRAQIDF